MGFSRANARFFNRLSNQINCSGHALTLGVQNLSFEASDLPVEMQTKLNGQVLNYKSLLTCMGFDQVSSLDVSDYEGADFIGDLNSQDIGHHGLFDVIFDTGTLEHIFHVPNALSNMGRMLKNNGRVIHVLPTSNRLEHGFYMFCPTLFWDYYQANNYVIEKSYIIRNYIKEGHYIWELFPFFPSNLDWLSMGKLDGSAYSTVFIARKTPESSDGNIPQQRRASQFWSSKSYTEQTLPTNRSIDKMSNEVWLVGCNQFTEQLVDILDKHNVKVLGIADTLKYGYECAGIPVIHPARLMDMTFDDQSIILCARNLQGKNRNNALLGSLFNKQQCCSLSIFFDTDIANHQLIGDDYAKLAKQFDKQILTIDPVLKLHRETIL